MRYIFFLLATMLVSSAALAAHETKQLEIDMTYGGNLEQVIYEVSTEDWSKSVNWSFSIYSQGQLLFQHVVEGEDNKDFQDEGYIDNCSSHAECRQEWYVKQAFGKMIDVIKPTEPRHDKILQSSGLRPTPAYLSQLVAFLLDKDIVGFALPKSPVQFGTLMTYDKFSGDFVPLYHP
ncbi:MAG: hypothetical protein RQ754_02190 [Desulfuromonadales bacterium]|nr:hypothetical protein [Desulfuromonadales bacterium]